MKNFELNNYNLSLLQKKNRLYSYLNSKLDKAYFKLSSDGHFEVALCGGDGLVKTTLSIDYDGEDTYFSLDFNKWQIALQKFSGVDVLKFSLNKSLLKIFVEGSSDVINLGVINYEEDSDVAHKVNDFISERKKDIVSFNHLLTLTPEILSHFDLMNNLFTTQNRVNSIGVNRGSAIYSDRSVVVKAHFEEDLPEDLFKGLEEGEDHIYLHTFTLKLFEMLSEFNNDVYFDGDYEVIYWGDDETNLVICSDSKNFSLPTDEQFEGIKPQNEKTFIEVNLDEVKKCLDFFKGVYEESSWKPLKFNMVKGKEVVVNYKHPTTEAQTKLEGVISKFDGSFVIDAETLRKIVFKIRDRLFEGEVFLHVNFDESSVKEEDKAPGVYCTVGKDYEFIISTLLDD